MQTLELGPTIAEVAARVLESMCFMSILEEVPASEESDGLWMAAKLNFQGSPSGNFGLGISELAARSTAANFLGLEAEELSEMQISEVIGELTNMIAGSLLSGLETNCCFTLSHPQIESSDDFKEQMKTAGGHIFQMEDGLLAVWLQVTA